RSYCFVQRALRIPSTRNFPAYGVASLVGGGRRLSTIDNIGGCVVEETTQGAAHRLLDWYIVHSLEHVGHPRIPLFRPDFEAQMRFAQAQPPAALRISARPTQELGEKGCEFFDRAMESLPWEKRTEQRVARHTSVKRSREFAAHGRAANGLVQVNARQHSDSLV